MKYAFCGSHGTGKSAAAHFLASNLKRQYPHKTIKVLEEAVRESAKLVGINNENFQKLAISHSIYNQVLYSSIYDILVCDRIALDYVVYAIYYGVKLPKEYYDLAYQNAKEFDKIYFVRPDNAFIADDGFRFTNVQERNKIDKIFKDILIMQEIEHEEISTTQVFK